MAALSRLLLTLLAGLLPAARLLLTLLPGLLPAAALLLPTTLAGLLLLLTRARVLLVRVLLIGIRHSDYSWEVAGGCPNEVNAGNPTRLPKPAKRKASAAVKFVGNLVRIGRMLVAVELARSRGDAREWVAR